MQNELDAQKQRAKDAKTEMVSQHKRELWKRKSE
jgi:hypothetical protein